ncbi:MAG: lysylphosphatidylglycerol synthase transmembrane domain-containing protein [Halochromatium sp.]|uniref:lysylphosphatidylglycerol synthase transmembrane domain-containing protein n=1 Tax=Halochromatium sp. TaxID=2049430 RepID=UPI0039792910
MTSFLARRPRLGRQRDWLVGVVLLIVVVTLVESTLGWSVVLAPWATLPPWVLAAAFLLTAASYLLRAIRVRVYFQTELAGRFPALLRLSVLHNSANNLLPMRAGEVLFPWLMRRYFGHGFWAAGASLIWIRLLDLHFLGVIGLLVLWTRAPSPWWGLLILGWLGLLPLFWLAGRVQRQAGAEGGEGRWRRLLGVVAAAAPRERGQVLRLYRWTALSWSLKFVAFALILGHFVPAALWQLLLGVMGAELSTVLPFHGIAGSGSFELATVAALVPLGVAPAQALAGAVNLHLFLLGTTLVLGAGALLIPIRGQRGG